MDALFPLLASGWHYLFGILMFLTALFLILLVLVQRGRGGGLAGAFGGMGGQSAFGTKAGDLFTRLTMGVAGFWIVLCVLAIAVLNRQTSVFGDGPAAPPSALGTDDGGQMTPPGSDILLPGAGAEPAPAPASDGAAPAPDEQLP